MNKLVSVIVPVYNVEEFIKKCVDSILTQTYKNIEIILVDDGSTDRSGKICDAFLNIDKRIKVYHKKNGGLSDARNYGICHASGSYLVFVDSDDVVSNLYVEQLYNMCLKCGAQIAVGQCIHCKTQENIEFDSSGKIKLMSHKDAIISMLYQRDMLVSACAKMYKSEIFEDIRFPVGMLFEDSAIMYKLFEKADIIAVSDAKIYGYVHREDSITTQKFSKRDFDILHISKEIYSYYEDKDESLMKAAMSYLVVAGLRIYMNCPRKIQYQNDLKEAEKLIEKYGRRVYKDCQIRVKLKLALGLYFYAKPLMKIAYRMVGRWS